MAVGIPKNFPWCKKGDIVRCVSAENYHWITIGHLYVINARMSDGYVNVENDNGNAVIYPHNCFVVVLKSN